ncbi:MAG: hypothetical protein ABIP94_03510 [Planctomycetota bacterium]
MPELEGMWSAGKDAVRHGSVLARIGVWGLGARVRASLGRLFTLLVAAATVAAIAITAAVWTTAHLLRELNVILGGGLLGTVLAIGILLTSLAIVGLLWKFRRNHARAARWRRKLDPAASKESAKTPAQAQLDELRADALANWHDDSQRVIQRGSAIWRMHPVASLGVGAASGFLASRWLLATPRKLRRGAVGVFRVARSLGVASLANTAMEALGVRNTKPAKAASPSNSSPPR